MRSHVITTPSLHHPRKAVSHCGSDNCHVTPVPYSALQDSQPVELAFTSFWFSIFYFLHTRLTTV